MSPQKQRASIRLKYQILQMKKYMMKHGIDNTEISKRSGITAPNVWRFINSKSDEPSTLTFLMIAEAIGYTIDISITEPNKPKVNKKL